MSISVEEVQQLKDALDAAQSVLQEQDAIIKQLMAPPFNIATVLDTTEDPAGPQDFVKGVSVRIRQDSQYHEGHSGDGKITRTSDAKGWVQVEWPDGFRNTYRIGLPDVDDGACDLEVIDRANKRAVIALEGKTLQVSYPKHITVKPGDFVLLSTQTGNIVDIASMKSQGTIGAVRNVLDEVFSEIDHEGTVRLIRNGRYGGSLKKGDRVIADSTASVITRNLGQKEDRFNFTSVSNVSWDDIGGLTDAKGEMIEAIEMPFRHADLYRFYGKKPVKGVMLYGPPGCGKTMLGKATVTALAAIHGNGSTSSGFIYVKGPEILDKYVGVAEATIRSIFHHARQHKDANGYPAVIFIDEADAIMSKRGSGISSDIERTIVPMFLAEMDGLEESGAIVILATNRPDILDPAVVREGRIDRKIKVGRPDKDAAKDIFSIYLKNLPLNNGYSSLDLAEIGSRELYSDKWPIYCLTKHGGEQLMFTLSQIVSGAMIATVVDQATSMAMHRDIARGGKGKGLQQDDLIAAIQRVYAQNLDLDHRDDLADFVHNFRDDIESIHKQKMATA